MNEEKTLPPQGVQRPSGLCEDVIIPDNLVSSSYEELTGVLPAGTLAALTTAEIVREEREKAVEDSCGE